MHTLFILHDEADFCSIILIQRVRHWSAGHDSILRFRTRCHSHLVSPQQVHKNDLVLNTNSHMQRVLL